MWVLIQVKSSGSELLDPDSESLRVASISEYLQFYSELLGGVSELLDPDSE